MRNFDINPLSYDDYMSDRLYEGEKVYRVTFGGGIDEAYAIREDGEEYDEFECEVEWKVRRHKGNKAYIHSIADVTGTFDDDGEEE